MAKLDNNSIYSGHPGGAYSKRYTKEGILCYGCDKICQEEDFWKGVTRCKKCCSERTKKVQKRKKQPLW